MANINPPRPTPTLNISLWITQSLLCVLYIGTAFWKVLTPIPVLAEMIPWVGEHSPALLYTTALADLCGGIGILLPSVMRIRPQLAVWAACGCVALQVSAIVFHALRGEMANTPFNFVLVALAGFVWWGRRAAVAPLRARA